VAADKRGGNAEQRGSAGEDIGGAGRGAKRMRGDQQGGGVVRVGADTVSAAGRHDAGQRSVREALDDCLPLFSRQ